MAETKSAKSTFQSIKESWTREDTLLVSMLAFGAALFLSVIFITPVKNLVIEPIANLVGASESKPKASKEIAVARKGLFQVGKMIVSLAKRDEYLDSEIDLEYDMGVLRIHLDGDIEDIKGANKFCESHKTKMKDAIINSISSISVQDIKTSNGYDELKSTLLEAVNNAVEGNRNIFTNIFFRRFLLMPAES